MNLFVTAINKTYNGDALSLEIARVTSELLKALQDGMPFSQIILMFNSHGYECTIDDLLAWSAIYKKTNQFRPVIVNNDTGVTRLSEDSVYNTLPETLDVHFTPSVKAPQILEPDVENTSTSNSSIQGDTLDSTIASTIPSESLSPLFGFLLTLVVSIVCNVLIENLKTYLGIQITDTTDESQISDD